MNRKQVLCRLAAAILLVLCLVVGWLQGRSTGQEEPAAETASAARADHLEQFRTERQQLRQMQTAQLKEIIYNADAEPEIASMAQRRLMELMTWTEQETALEGILLLREFDDVVVTVHTGSVNVMVRAKALTERQTAVILELVMRETGVSAENIKIIPIN